MINKNDVVTVKIEDISSEGQGIGIIRDESTGADACGFVLFIKDTVIGDVVEAKVMKTKKTYGYARLVRIIEPSPDPQVLAKFMISIIKEYLSIKRLIINIL